MHQYTLLLRFRSEKDLEAFDSQTLQLYQSTQPPWSISDESVQYNSLKWWQYKSNRGGQDNEDLADSLE